MRVTKKILLDYARFLFRSGEISFDERKTTLYSKEIDDYIFETWKEFINKRLSTVEEKTKIEFKQTQENL